MINTLMLIDDENLFHLVFEDACSLLDIALSIEALDSSDEADKKFQNWFPDDPEHEKPECVFVDLNIIGSSYDGIEMIRKINYEYGNGCVIGIISSSSDPDEIAKAKRLELSFGLLSQTI
jgi:DNA-binding NarL/FixJ family response regulator